VSVQTESRSERVKRSWAARREKYGPSGYPPGAKHGWRCPDDEYNRRWLERVLANCKRTESGCLIWKGWKNHRGYGWTTYRSVNGPVHRHLFQVVTGIKLTRWEFACHKCDVRDCCEIEHLFKGTPKENQQDMSRKGRAGLQQATHCKHGHEFTPENTLRPPSTGRRSCRLCSRLRGRLKAGWPYELANKLPKQKLGHRPVAVWKEHV
jgi:hypothetical protein